MDGPSQSQHSNSRTQICPVFQARVASSGVEGRQLVLCLCVTQVNNDYIITKRPFGDGFWSAASAAQLRPKKFNGEKGTVQQLHSMMGVLPTQ